MENDLKRIRKGEFSSGGFRTLKAVIFIPLFILALISTAGANPLGATIQYQPMTSDGLAAGYPFESWVVFDMSSDPTVPGLSLPAGATFRFTFPLNLNRRIGMLPRRYSFITGHKALHPFPLR